MRAKAALHVNPGSAFLQSSSRHSANICCLSRFAMSDRSRHDLDSDAAGGWGESATSSVEPGQQAKIKTFTSVTGADDDTALHVLEAHNWDVDRSVMFFLEGGPSAQPQPRSVPAPSGLPAASAPPAPSAVRVADAPIDLDDDPEQNASEHHQQAHASGAAPPSQQEVSSHNDC